MGQLALYQKKIAVLTLKIRIDDPTDPMNWVNLERV
jgi:hypothetical protein